MFNLPFLVKLFHHKHTLTYCFLVTDTTIYDRNYLQYLLTIPRSPSQYCTSLCKSMKQSSIFKINSCHKGFSFAVNSVYMSASTSLATFPQTVNLTNICYLWKLATSLEWCTFTNIGYLSVPCRLLVNMMQSKETTNVCSLTKLRLVAAFS